MRRSTLKIAALTALLTFGSGRALHAAVLTWRAPEDCPTQAEILEQVERMTGQDFAAIDSMDFEVSVEQSSGEMSGQGGSEHTWRVRLVTVEREANQRRQRDIAAGSCKEAGDAAALAMAMTIQAEPQTETDRRKPATREEPTVEPAAERDSANPSPTNADAGDSPRRAGAGSEPIHVALGIGGAVDAGALPSATLGAEVLAAANWRRVRAMLLGSIFAPQRTELVGGSGGEFALRLLGALGCYEPVFTAWTGLLCAGVEVGTLSGEGVGPAVQPRLGTAFWKATRIETGVISPSLGPLRFMARIGLVLPWSSPAFVLDGTRQVHSPADMVWRASLGVELPL